jgi:hypothetical protein
MDKHLKFTVPGTGHIAAFHIAYTQKYDLCQETVIGSYAFFFKEFIFTKLRDKIFYKNLYTNVAINSFSCYGTGTVENFQTFLISYKSRNIF